jgi:hypothetical protein
MHTAYDARLEHATIPIQIVATDVISGTEVAVSHGDPVPAVASAAIPATDFRHAASPIERARSATARWLGDGNHLLPHPERFLSLHRHPAPVAPGDRTAPRDAAECHERTAR